MSDIVLQVNNISKLFRLGTTGSGSLKHDLNEWLLSLSAKKRAGRSDYSCENEKESGKDFLWALRNLNLEIREGESWGIIGNNGAGKSTFLKIVSRIIKPTTGSIKGKGKVSSLLEVGTGFNADLTGRENIFMSGYFLGMQKKEILRKFDEIVDFSGVELFLDTPVKRYSSGMYVRLAFAVAAHLEPDILIVDEVLAVGDQDFQKKCLGKMKDVSTQKGRTVLFVSHNLTAVESLCSNAVWLDKGTARFLGTASETVSKYLSSTKIDYSAKAWDLDLAPGNELIKMKCIRVKAISEHEDNLITVHTPIQLDVEFWCLTEHSNININVRLLTTNGECIFELGTESLQAEKAVLTLKSIIPGNLLNNAAYNISLTIVENNRTHLHEFYNCISFEVADIRRGMHYFGEWPGIIRPQIESSFRIKKVSK